MNLEAIDLDLATSTTMSPNDQTPALPLSTGLLAPLSSTLSAAAGLSSAAGSSISKEEWEREKAVLYAQLDEKDDELNTQSQTIEKYLLQLNEQEELIGQLRKENDEMQSRISALESDNEAQKDEVKEVLKALEELAMNFDQKQQEAEIKSKENETLTQELDRKLTNLQSIQEELETLKEVAHNQRKRLLDMMITLLKDLGEIGGIVGGNMVANDFKKPSLDNMDSVEDDFTMARLYVSKLKTEVKALTQKCALLDEQKLDSVRTFEQKDRELEEVKLNLIQSEVRLKSQQEYGKELEAKKKRLEEELDIMRGELAKAQAVSAAAAGGDEMEKVQKALKEQLESHVEQLKSQMKDLREEANANQKKCHELQELVGYFGVVFWDSRRINFDPEGKTRT